MKNLVYKYLPSERISYLEDGFMRITQPGDLNDPFECLPVQPSVDEIIYVLEDVLKRRLEEISKSKLTKSKKKDLRLLECKRIKTEITKVRKNLDGNYKERFLQTTTKTINDLLGIISLSKRWDSSLMWAHYTRSHMGYCIGFDADHPFFAGHRELADRSKIFLPVVYSDERIKVPINNGEKIDPIVMLTKSLDWAYEEEMRLIVHLGLTEKRIALSPFDICLMKIPHFLIREIVVGAKILDLNFEQVRDFCVKNSIPLYRSLLSANKFDMERDLIQI